MDEPQSRNNSRRQRVRIGLVLLMIGVVVFIIGTEPERFGLDRSPITGFVQISVFLIGLAMICVGGYISLQRPVEWHAKNHCGRYRLAPGQHRLCDQFCFRDGRYLRFWKPDIPQHSLFWPLTADWGNVWGSDDHHRLRLDDPILQPNTIATFINSIVRLVGACQKDMC